MATNIVVDASALVALILSEPGYTDFASKLKTADLALVTAPSALEAVMALSRYTNRDPVGQVESALFAFSLTVVPIADIHWKVASEAFLKYGKGRHPAKLNFGDCMTYAISKVSGYPLLFKGDELRQD